MTDPPLRLASSDLWISGDVLSGCEDVGKQLGLDVGHYLQRSGIERQLGRSSQGLLPFGAVCNFLEDVAKSEGLPDFGFRLARAQQPLQYGIISQLPLLSPTIGAAMSNFIRYQKLYSQSSHWELSVDAGCAFMRRHDVAKSARASPQLIVLSVTLLIGAMRSFAGSSWRPIGIYFDLDDFPYRETMRSHFGAPVFCGSAHNEIAFPEEDLELPVASSDPALLAVLKQHFDRLLQAVPDTNDITSMVFHEIRSNLGDHRCDLDWIARSLHLHPRSLQRLLDNEGTSFRDLLRDARIELADYLLRLSRTPISDISALLGYSNPSAFSRAFEKVRGHSPSRERLLAREAAVRQRQMQDLKVADP